MSNLAIGIAPPLTGATLAAGDKIPVLDISAAAGSMGSSITADQLNAWICGAAGGGLRPIVLESGALTLLPASTGDIGTITVPSWIASYKVLSGAAAQMSGVLQLTGGVVTGAQIALRDTAAGGGAAMSGNSTLTSISTTNFASMTITQQTLQTSGTIHINQTVASTNAGTIRVYVAILPVSFA